MKKCYVFGHEYVVNKGRNTSRYGDYICIHCGHTTDDPETSKWDYTFWQSDSWEIITFWFKVILVIIAIILTFCGIYYFIDSNTCNQYKNIGIDVMFNFWTGCMANHPKFGWIPIEKYFEVLNLYVK